jgi:hypothetical protein
MFFFVLEMFKYIELVFFVLCFGSLLCMEIKKPVFFYVYWWCQVLYISIHRCHCVSAGLCFSAVVSFLILDVDVFKEGLLCT